MTNLDKSFYNLPISTQTVMAYLNCTFNIDAIFERLPVENIGQKSLKNIKGKHGVIYQLKRAGCVRGLPTKKGDFRNQITTSIYIIDKIITAKIFPTGKFHLTGCKNANHQKQAVIELVKNIRLINSEENPTIIMEDKKPLNVIIEVVMVNVDFHLGFDIDRKKLDKLPQNSKNDFYTMFETSINTSVNIKLYYNEPRKRKYDKIIIKGTPKNPKITYTTCTKCPKAKKCDTRRHTFLVFSSGKVIQSGRYYDSEMEQAYKKFREFVEKNRENIELKLNKRKFDMTKLTGLKNKLSIEI